MLYRHHRLSHTQHFESYPDNNHVKNVPVLQKYKNFSTCKAVKLLYNNRLQSIIKNIYHIIVLQNMLSFAFTKNSRTFNRKLNQSNIVSDVYIRQFHNEFFEVNNIFIEVWLTSKIKRSIISLCNFSNTFKYRIPFDGK